MKNRPPLFQKFVRNPLIVIGLSLFFQTMNGQDDRGFLPANYENRLLKIPDCGERLPGDTFSVEAVIQPESNSGRRPILSKGKSGDAWFCAFLLDDGCLAWEFSPVGKTDPESFEFTVPKLVYRSREKLFFSGEPTRVGFVHGADGVQFFVNRRPVAGFWGEKTAPAPAFFNLEAWKIGSIEPNSELDEPSFFNGKILGIACWNTDQSKFWTSNPTPEGLFGYTENLVFGFDLSQVGPGFGQNLSESIPNIAGTDSDCWNAWLPLKNPVNGGDSESVDVEPEAADWSLPLAIFIVIFLTAATIWVANGFGTKPYTTSQTAGKNAKILAEDLPVELAGLPEKEEIDFIIRSRLPLPWWKIFKIAGYAAGGIFLTNGWWVEVFEQLLGPDDQFSVGILLPKLLPIGAAAVGFWIFTREEWLAIFHSASNRAIFVGTSERLLLINAEAGDFRPIFWEQIRGVEKFGDRKTLRLELRTCLSTDKENYFTEKIWLTGIESGRKVAEFIQIRLNQNPISDRKEDFLEYGRPENFQYRNGQFGEMEVYRQVVFVRKSPFQGRPFLMRRGRIQGLDIEPYDLPEPGWLLFARLESGHRQPFFFNKNLKEMQEAKAFLVGSKP